MYTRAETYAVDVLLDGVWQVEEEPVALEHGQGTSSLVRTSLAPQDITKQNLGRLSRLCTAGETLDKQSLVESVWNYTFE